MRIVRHPMLIGLSAFVILTAFALVGSTVYAQEACAVADGLCSGRRVSQAIGMTRLPPNQCDDRLFRGRLPCQQRVELPGELRSVVVEVQLDNPRLKPYGLRTARPSPLPPEVAS